MSIQLLRGIASLLVLCLHSVYKEKTYGEAYFDGFSIGHIGVDIFFIISGFVMLYTLNPELDAKKFLLKRVIRILPVYWATLCIAITVYLINPSLVNGGRDSSILGSIFLIPTHDLFLNQNAWTLTYEFIFYIIFSTLFIFKGDYKVVSVVFVILALSCVGQIISVSNPLLSYITSSLLIEFIYGFFLCYFYKYFDFKFKMVFVVLNIILSLLVISSNIGVQYRFLYLGLPALTTCCIIILFDDWINKYTAPLSDFLGDISYSLYLIHPFTLSGTSIILRHFEITNPYLFVTILISVSLFSGWLTFQLIEQPLTTKIQSIYKNRNAR